MREGRGEELTGLRQTQRMAAAVDPCCPPTLQQEQTQRFAAKRDGIGSLLCGLFPQMLRCKRHIWRV